MRSRVQNFPALVAVLLMLTVACSKADARSAIDQWWDILTSLDIWAGAVCIFVFNRLESWRPTVDRLESEGRIGPDKAKALARSTLIVLLVGLALIGRGCVHLSEIVGER